MPKKTLETQLRETQELRQRREQQAEAKRTEIAVMETRRAEAEAARASLDSRVLDGDEAAIADRRAAGERLRGIEANLEELHSLRLSAETDAERLAADEIKLGISIKLDEAKALANANVADAAALDAAAQAFAEIVGRCWQRSLHFATICGELRIPDSHASSQTRWLAGLAYALRDTGIRLDQMRQVTALPETHHSFTDLLADDWRLPTVDEVVANRRPYRQVA